MLIHEVTPELIEEWKTVWHKYKDTLRPNRKSGNEITAYVKNRYPLTELTDEEALQVVAQNVLQNDFFSEKLPKGKMPRPVVFVVENRGNGKHLYDSQDDVFAGTDIIVGIDFESGFLVVEGSSCLADELCAFRGLDAGDIDNYFCVVEYISCLAKYPEFAADLPYISAT